MWTHPVLPHAHSSAQVDVFGDMGVYTWNNMANMYEANQKEETDLVIHMGDHAVSGVKSGLKAGVESGVESGL
jgi:phosphodiesterase/alkaline phosphatase D-like protein